MTTTMKGTQLRIFVRKVGHFLWHYLQMCLACCVGGVTLSVAFFGGAALIGYPDLVDEAPMLSTLVLAINVSIPMVAWMRFRHHEWRPTLEMAGATMGLGIVLIASGLLGLIPVSAIFEWMTSLACPVMLAPMLLRFNLYAGAHHTHARHSILARNKSKPLTDAVRTFNKHIANPAMMKLAGRRHWFASVIRHKGRRSGREYATPILALPTSDGFIISLPYGESVDWLKNVLAAGRARIEAKGETWEIVEPEVVDREIAKQLLPRQFRLVFELGRIKRYLKVRKLAESPSATVDDGGMLTTVETSG